MNYNDPMGDSYDPAVEMAAALQDVADFWASYNLTSGGSPRYKGARGMFLEGSVYYIGRDYSGMSSGRNGIIPVYSGIGIDAFLNTAMNSTYGGTWSNGEVLFFRSNEDVMAAGAAYNELHNSWGSTYQENLYQYWDGRYFQIKDDRVVKPGTDIPFFGSEKTNVETSYPDLFPSREPYTWLEYAWTAGIENGIRYDRDGKALGFAPITGSPNGWLMPGGIGASSSITNLRTIISSWKNVNFNSISSAIKYHMKHADGRSIFTYTDDALSFFKTNKDLGKEVLLKDGSIGIKIRFGGNQPGGIFTPDGKIVTFWYK